MTRHVLLNNVEHRDLRIITRRGADVGDTMMSALTFPAEFRNVQAEYPIVFARPEVNKYLPLAIFGFREKQNLFVKNDQWDALYIPLMVERIPFLIGQAANGKVIHIDLDSARISQTEGERVFLDNGGNAPYLDHVSRMLGTLDEGLSTNEPFMNALLEHNLLESFTIDISFRDGGQQRFTGFYAIQEERLAKLDGAALARLHERGYLLPMFMQIASMSNFRSLIDRANKLDPADR